MSLNKDAFDASMRNTISMEARELEIKYTHVNVELCTCACVCVLKGN